MTTELSADVLYALNDAIGMIVADYGLLTQYETGDRDDIINDAVHAAANVLSERTTT